MSIRISGNKLAIGRTVNLPTSHANFTICLFAKLATAHSTYHSHIAYTQSTGGSHAQSIQVRGGGGLSLIGTDSYESNESSVIATLTDGAASGEGWFFTALRGNAAGADGMKVYHKPVVGGSMASATFFNSPGSAGFDALRFGDAPFDPGQFGIDAWWFDGYIAGLKIYNSSLSDAAVAAEAAQLAVADGTNLISYHAFSSMTLATALAPTSGSGTFSAFTSDPTTSADNPVFATNPVYSGSVQLPNELVIVTTGAPPPITQFFLRR